MKRLALVLLPVFAVFLMSHNVSAASSIINDFHGWQSNITGVGNSQGNIRFQAVYNITGSNDYSYIANGESTTSWNWNYGHNYQVIFVETLDASGVDLVVPNPIFIQGEHYHTEKDNIQSSVSCGSSSCKFTMIHTLDVVGDSNGSETVKIPSSIILNVKQSGASFRGKFNLYVVLFDNVDEAMAFRTNLMNKLNDINSDTTDILNTLDDINDKLDKLDTNADKNEEGWQNMQNTDGLIDVGDNSSFMDSFNGLNNFFGGLKNKTADNCVVNANFEGRVNMGDIDLCFMPDNIKSIVSTIAGVVFAIFDLLLVWNSIHYIVGLIDWSRRN